MVPGSTGPGRQLSLGSNPGPSTGHGLVTSLSAPFPYPRGDRAPTDARFKDTGLRSPASVNKNLKAEGSHS